MRRKITYDIAKQVAERFTKLSDFRKNDRSLYAKAYRNGWLKDFAWLQKSHTNGYYTYEKCREIASQCDTRTEFFLASKTAYRYSIRNGWLDDFKWLKKPAKRQPRGYWTKERTRYALKICSGYKELIARFGQGAKSAALRYGIYKEMYDKEMPIKITELEKCLIAAIGSINAKQMKADFPKEYALAKKNGWLDNYNDFWV